tara:strand:+ start:184 stop:354 length:171 start_codon:yes stop_codon:yes gene_type:complete
LFFESLLSNLGPELGLGLCTPLLIQEICHGSLLGALVPSLSHTRRSSALLLQDVAL